MSKFAYVRYISDNVKSIVPVHNIKRFTPANDSDFVKQKPYRVLWANEDGEEEYYKAQILMLADTEEKLEVAIKKSRVKVPKILDTSVEETSDEDLQSTAKIERKQKKANIAAVEKNALSDILNEKLKERRGSPLCPPAEACSSKSLNGDSVSQEEYLKLAKSTEKYKQRCSCLKSEVATLTEQLDSLRKELAVYKELNVDLQKSLLKDILPSAKKIDKNSHIHMQEGTSKQLLPIKTGNQPLPPVNQEPPPEETPEDESRLDEQSEMAVMAKQNGNIHLGGSIVMPIAKWEMVKANKKASMFVKSLIMAVWGTEKLANRSVEGKICPRHKGSGKTPKPALTPQKYNAVKERFLEYLATSGRTREEVAVETSRFNKYVTEKICDLNRPVKRKLLE